MIPVQAQIETQDDISLTNISQKTNELNIPKQILQKTMEKIQDTIIND